MSFDDYAQHIYKKYRLCIAIAVLNTKPLDVDTTQYLNELKSKMAYNMVDDDVTVCSDDFKMDCYDEIDDRNNEILVNIEENIKEQIVQPQNLHEDESQTTYDSQSQSILSPHLNGSQTYFETPNTQYINDNINKNNENNNNNNINDKEAKNSLNVPKRFMNNSVYDSQKTILYTVPNFSQNYTHVSQSQNYIAIPNNYLFGIDRNKINEKGNAKNPIDKENSGTFNKTCLTKNAIKEIISKENVLGKNTIEKNHNLNECSRNSNVYSENILISNYIMNATNNDTNGFNDYFNEINRFNDTYNENNLANTQIANVETVNSESILKDYNNATNNDTGSINDHFNEIHRFNDTCNENNLAKSRNTNVETVNSESILKDYNNAINNDKIIANNNEATGFNDYFNEINNFNENYLDTLRTNDEFQKEIKNNDITNVSNHYSQNVNDCFNEANHFNDTLNDNSKELSSINKDITPVITESFQTNININNDPKILTKQSNLNCDNKPSANIDIEISTQPSGQITQSANDRVSFETIEEDLDVAEVIPYKVLEELNKIKMFLKRKERRVSSDGFSTDSGYRSDSQTKSSNKSALQLSGVTINQCAYCLFYYLKQCHLVAATRDITTEIAQTLSLLIDKLHEDENYPPFLDELLDTIDLLLQQVFTGRSSDESEFLRKDEIIQRIFLLNRSTHIQKHTISEITKILIKFHEKVTDENSTYELTDIDEVENISYIFHLLEILLKKYIKSKNDSSQISQTSQDDRIFKKSSITDIWRRKWNSNFEKTVEGSCKSRCVLKECSEILNKIVVGCVNSYSLVAYAALKCFNCMQF